MKDKFNTSEENIPFISKQIRKSYIDELFLFALDCSDYSDISIDESVFYTLDDKDYSSSNLFYWKLEIRHYQKLDKIPFHYCVIKWFPIKFKGSSINFEIREFNKDIDKKLLGLENGIYTNPFIIISNPSKEFFYDLLKSDKLTVFEVIAISGYSTDRYNGVLEFTKDSLNIFYNFILKKKETLSLLRHPRTNTTYDVDYHNLDFPSLSWMFSFDDAKEWCNKTFNIDLEALRNKLGCELGKENNCKGESQEAVDNNEKSISNQDNDLNRKYIELEKLDPRERKTLRCMIAGLCEMLKKGPNDKDLVNELFTTMERLDIKRDKETIERHLKAASKEAE